MARPLFSTLDRYLFRQLFDFFLLGMVVCSLVVLFADAFLDYLREIQKFGIPPSVAFTMLGLHLPYVFALALIPSTFLAVLMVYHTLNNHFELIAFRMNGISLKRLVTPPLLLGAATALLNYALLDYVSPYCERLSEQLKDVILKQGRLPESRESFVMTQYDDDAGLQKVIFVGRVNGRTLENTTMIDQSDKGMLQIVQAQAGEWYPNRWIFTNANTYTVGRNSKLMVSNHTGRFTAKNFFLESDDEKPAQKRMKFSSMSFAELFAYIQGEEARGEKLPAKVYNKLWDKLTFPIACFVIVLCAVPLAITPPRQGSDTGFILSLGVLFLFYLMRTASAALGSTGLFTLGGLIPENWGYLVGAWLPLVILGGLGVGLLVRKSRRL